jgi:hypothetical protein
MFLRTIVPISKVLPSGLGGQHTSIAAVSPVLPRISGTVRFRGILLLRKIFP